jgi:hypothetical protein
MSKIGHLECTNIKWGCSCPKLWQTFEGLKKNILMRHHPLKSNKSTKKGRLYNFREHEQKLRTTKKKLRATDKRNSRLKKSLLQNLDM